MCIICYTLQTVEDMGINFSRVERRFIVQPHTSHHPYSTTPVQNLKLPPPVQSPHRAKGQRQIKSDFTPGGAGLAVLDRCMQHMASAHLIAESMIKMEGKEKYKKCMFYE